MEKFLVKEKEANPSFSVSFLELCIYRYYLRDIASLVADHCNKVNITITKITQMFWFPNAYESYVYTVLHSIKCAI